jgi:hypothetical protein
MNHNDGRSFDAFRSCEDSVEHSMWLKISMPKCDWVGKNGG